MMSCQTIDAPRLPAHFNPVKHGLVSRVSDWPHSSFHQHVKRGLLPVDWGGDMRDVPGSTFGE